VAVAVSVTVGDIASADEVVEIATLCTLVVLELGATACLTHPANLDRMIVRDEERSRAITDCSDTVRCEDRITPGRAYMTHCLLTLPHLEDFDRGICAALRRIDDVVEGSNGWSLVHKVEAHGVIIQNLNVEAKEIEIEVTGCASVSDRFDGSHVEEPIKTWVVDVQGH
jgi:hypothetical protein